METVLARDPVAPAEGAREPRWPVAGFVATTAAGLAISLWIARGSPILAGRWGILWRLGLWTAVAGGGVACALRLPGRRAVLAIVGAGLLLRLAAMAGPPVLSDDLYRYSWDGRVQSAGYDAYRYAPTAPQLNRLHEPWLWPGAVGCVDLDRLPGCTRINRPTERTLYPPLAEAWFEGVYRITGIGSRYKAWQGAGLLTDMALIALLPSVLAAWGKDRRWTALYALAPFPVVEVVNNGHVDGLAALLVVVALLFAARRRPAWAGAMVGAATLVKLYPALLVLALVGVLARRLPSLWKAAAAMVAVVAAGYLPHVIVVGTRVLGYLPGYLREEHYDTAGRYLLAGLLGLPAHVTTALAVGGVAAVLGWAVVRRPAAPQAAAALMGALLLATTPVQPWYAVTLVAVATVAAAPAWLLVAGAGYPYFFAVILDHPHTVAVGRLSYGLAFLTVLLAAAVAVPRLRRVVVRIHRRLPILVGGAAVVTLVAGALVVISRPAPSAAIPKLPVLGASRDAYDGDLGDPYMLAVPNHGFWAFGTGDFPARIPTAHTDDLVSWQRGPDALPNLPSWSIADPRNSYSWAPSVLATKQGYVMYVSLREQASGKSCIALAKSKNPQGPYVDTSPQPFLCQRDLGGSIDATTVRDRNGDLHLLWKNDGNCCNLPVSIWEQDLSSDGLSLKGVPHQLLTADEPWQNGIVEEPAALPATGGGWWLFYSGNSFDHPEYATGLAYCTQLSGPCRETSDQPFLPSQGDAFSPGGMETFTAHGSLYAVFDIWNRPPRNGRYYCCRSLLLAPVLNS